METKEIDGPKEREPAWFEINMLRCIYCGFCEEVCPEEAIVMSKEYDLTFQDRDEAIFGLERLLVSKEHLEDRLRFLRAQRNPEPDAAWTYERSNNRHSLRDSTFLSTLEESLNEGGGARAGA